MRSAKKWRSKEMSINCGTKPNPRSAFETNKLPTQPQFSADFLADLDVVCPKVVNSNMPPTFLNDGTVQLMRCCRSHFGNSTIASPSAKNERPTHRITMAGPSGSSLY